MRYSIHKVIRFMPVAEHSITINFAKGVLWDLRYAILINVSRTKQLDEHELQIFLEKRLTRTNVWINL